MLLQNACSHDLLFFSYCVRVRVVAAHGTLYLAVRASGLVSLQWWDASLSSLLLSLEEPASTWKTTRGVVLMPTCQPRFRDIITRVLFSAGLSATLA